MLSRLRQFGSTDATPNAAAMPRMRLAQFDGWTIGAALIGALAALPIVAILAAAPGGGFEALAHLASSILPQYVLNTSALMLLAGLLAALFGIGTGWLIAASEFPGRKALAWALVLPLAVPPYVAAYVYADLTSFAGPLQTGLRDATGWQIGQYWFPQVRSLPGAALIFAVTLYPYVYLLSRAAFGTQSVTQFRAARSLGAGPSRAFWRVALPAARPAIAGGLALVMMEVLADFGVAEYFAIPTFSTGIFRSWLAMGDKQTALKLAAFMLVFVIALIALEASNRRGRTDSRDGHADSGRLVELSTAGRWLALAFCLIPLLLGFGIPALHLAWLAVDVGDQSSWLTLGSYARDSLWLGVMAALVCVSAALVLVFAQRRSQSRMTSAAIRIATLGYALPGALLAVGLLAPLGGFDQAITRFSRDTFGLDHGLLLGGTSIILIYALGVRFLTVAFNSTAGGMSKISPNLDAAARSLGARPGQVVRKVHIPLLLPSLASAVALVFIDTLRELPATLILRPFNLETLATRVYRLASDEKLAEASTASLLILAAGLIPVLLLNRASRAG